MQLTNQKKYDKHMYTKSVTTKKHRKTVNKS